ARARIRRGPPLRAALGLRQLPHPLSLQARGSQKPGDAVGGPRTWKVLVSAVQDDTRLWTTIPLPAAGALRSEVPIYRGGAAAPGQHAYLYHCVAACRPSRFSSEHL